MRHLQALLGLAEPSGAFDAETLEAVLTLQEQAGLGADGVVGAGTLEALNGWAPLFERSLYHDPARFTPGFPATAYAESGIYRAPGDPYALGAITAPSATADHGGKSYGVYQFESYVYRDGSDAGEDAVAGSTLARFVAWAPGPIGLALRETAEAEGLASEPFDALWTHLAAEHDLDFGAAQEAFLLVDCGPGVQAFFDAVGAPEAARQDPRLYDLVLGTLNQYGPLAEGMAAQLAEQAPEAGWDAAALGLALQAVKRERVPGHFRSSPRAQAGIYARIEREAALFR